MFAEVLKTKPHNLHYLNRYIKFINHCIDNPILSKTEDHHICPKSSDLFPEFKSFKKYPWNMAKLTLRQHYIAHRLLWKAFGGRQSQAFKLMCDRLVLNKSRCYEEVRKEHTEYMTTNNPITVDGEVYPLFSANLAISSSFKNGAFEANAAMRLVPTRLDENGNGVTSEENAKSVLVGTTQGISGAEQEAMAAIYAAVQNYVNVKGL